MRLGTIGTAQVSGLCIGGNKPIVPAFEKLSHSMCENDVALIGAFLKNDPDMIAQDVRFFDEHIDAVPA